MSQSRLPKNTAIEISDLVNRLYSNPLNYECVNPSKLESYLPLFENAKRTCEELGFAFLGDIQSQLMKELFPAVMSIERRFISFSGLINAIFFVPLGREAYDFDCEMSDGTFLSVSNALDASAMELPPEFHTKFMARETPPAILLKELEGLIERARKRNGAQPVRLTPMSMNGIIDRANRIHDLKSRFREAKGGLSGDEVMHARSLDPNAKTSKAASMVAAQVEKIRGKKVTGEK